ncbi:MAG TPA: sensor histidine kinase [Longimicrobiaceae bacterium]|nr:sensor histidine kinase [Longimicrobiaceae bacterium]
MEITVNCRLAQALAREIREAKEDLTRRWLERIAARVALDPNRVFPTDELLDHVPLLMVGIADYLEDPGQEISADMPVVGKAIELGQLRYSQGFDAHEILKEYEILGGVLFAFLARSADGIEEPCTRGELLACAHRLFRAVAIVQQFTTGHYQRLAAERVRERENRLRSFNRMVSHELKNRIGTVLGAAQMLREDWIAADPEKRARFSGIVANNAEAMQDVLQNLIELSRLDTDVRLQRNVLLPEAAAEVVRQLREMAQSRGVDVCVEGELPPVEVNAAAVELCLSNYVSNAIKYSDPAREARWVRIRGYVDGDHAGPGCELVVEVCDNGLGVPEEARDRLFQRFFRAHGGTVTGVEGTGLGLSIVRETVESLGGRAWASFPGEGSVFALAFPCRRLGERRETERAGAERG